MKIHLKLIICLSLLFAGYAFSSVQGTLRGVVKDKKGNPIEGVKVTIISLKYSMVKIVVKTNKNGEFIQIGLQPDYYQVRGEKEGYQPIFFEKRVPMAQTVDANFELEEGHRIIGEPPGLKDFERGNGLFKAGTYEGAAKAYLDAIQKEPQETIYRNNLGICYSKLEKYDEAIEAFKSMLQLQANSYSANRSLGELFGLQKKYQEALPFFAKATELSPDDPEAFYNLGACLVNTQDSAKAMEAFLRAKELKPDYANAYYQLGMIFINQNRKEEAVQHLEKFLELAGPQDPNASLARQLLDYLKK